MRRLVNLVPMLCAVANFGGSPIDSRVMFARGSPVPRSVQEFVWRVIETRCNYLPFERQQRSFWAYGARATRVDTGVVYSIKILSEVPWRTGEPPVFIEMTVLDDGGMLLTALKSSFITCVP